MNAAVSMLGMEERRWGQHDARTALTARSQRANTGPGPPRHSTTLPTDAPSPAGPTLSFFAGRRNRPASFWRWNGARQACEPPSRPAPQPDAPSGGPAGRACHNFPCRATPRPDAAKAERFASLPARAGIPAGRMTKPAIFAPPRCSQPRPPRRATASKANALFGVVDETCWFSFGDRTEPARPASLH